MHQLLIFKDQFYVSLVLYKQREIYVHKLNALIGRLVELVIKN